MYVCLCKAVSDSRIRRSVGEGACTVRDLAREHGLGTVCGKCVPTARELLSEALGSQPIRLADRSSADSARACAGTRIALKSS